MPKNLFGDFLANYNKIKKYKIKESGKHKNEKKN